MITLYNISAEQDRLNFLLEESGGEITPEMEEALLLNQENFLVKSECYISTIRKYSDMGDVIANEIKRLQAYKKTCENITSAMKGRLLTAMEIFGMEKIEVGTNRLSTRKSTSVLIEDETKIPSRYIVVSTSPNKKLIGEDLKAGNEVSGAALSYNTSLQIK